MKNEIETRMIVIAPTSEITPDQIVRFLHTLNLKITVKETCYGALIEGSREDIKQAVAEVRKLDPCRIFVKLRGFPIGDQRRCRALHGSRPGFTQLEEEWRMLAMIEKGIRAAEKEEKLKERVKQKKKLPVEALKKVIDEVIG
ncbi:MAG: methanogenesis marker 6 protein [Methanomassiliicoccales archaeon]